jgi:hypothetical protein
MSISQSWGIAVDISGGYEALHVQCSKFIEQICAVRDATRKNGRQPGSGTVSLIIALEDASA